MKTALTGTSRETITKILRDFGDQHLIRLTRSTLSPARGMT